MALFNLNDSIEMDEGFFSIATPKGTKLKRGKAVEKTSYTGYYKMKVLETQKADSINEYLEEHINDYVNRIF